MDTNNNIEFEAARALNQEPFEVLIGDKLVLFQKLSLSDREKISAYSSLLPEIDDVENRPDILYDAIECGKYAKLLARIISIAANPKSNWFLFKNIHIEYQKKRIYKLLLKEQMTIHELYALYVKIAEQIGPAFFLDIIISLRGTNRLKSTKETKPTAHGQ